MTILDAPIGKMYINRTKKLAAYMVVFCDKQYPNEEANWELLDEEEALAIEALWIEEANQAQSEELPEYPQPPMMN